MRHESNESDAGTTAPPIFIMGCEASGTNLTSQILDSHSRIAVCRGSQYYLLFASERRYYGDLHAGRGVARLINDFTETARGLGIDAPDSTAVLQELRQPTFEGVLAGFLSLYARGQGKPRAGERSVRNYAFLPQILAGFPASPVVFTMRDPRDLALAHKKGFGFGVDAAAASWNEAFTAYQTALRPVHLLRYEELVQRPEETVRALCAFIAEPFELEMLRFYERTPTRYRGLAHHERLSRPLDSETVGHFRELSDREIDLIEHRCAAGMRAVGYALVGRGDASPNVVAPARLALLRRVHHRLRYYRWDRERWRRGLLHWKIVLRARARHLLRL